LASGKQSNGILNLNVTDLQQHSSDNYSLSIEITLSDTVVKKSWFTVLIVKKMGKDSKIRLNFTFKNQDIIYPFDVPFEEYSLKGTLCRWRFNIEILPKAFLINSDEELDNYLWCNNVTYPVVDFSEYTLLLVGGYLPSSGGGVTEAAFIKNSKDNYTLDLTVFKGILGTPGPWFYSILISKIASETMVELNVTYY
jgi:hypothetical protein